MFCNGLPLAGRGTLVQNRWCSATPIRGEPTRGFLRAGLSGRYGKIALTLPGKLEALGRTEACIMEKRFEPGGSAHDDPAQGRGGQDLTARFLNLG